MNPFKAIGKGIAKGAKALVGKGQAAPRTFSNRGGSAAPTDAGYRTPKAEMAGPAALPNVRRSGEAKGTYTEAKGSVAPSRPSWGQIAGSTAKTVTAKAKAPTVTSPAPSAPTMSANIAPASTFSRNASPQGWTSARATPAKAAGSVGGVSRTIGQRISDRARARFYRKTSSRSPSKGR